MAQHMKEGAEVEVDMNTYRIPMEAINREIRLVKAENIMDEPGFEEFASKEKVKALVSGIAVIVVNLVAYIFGITLDAGVIVDAVMGVVILCVTVYAAWKNHNITKAAAAGQMVLNQAKADDA